MVDKPKDEVGSVPGAEGADASKDLKNKTAKMTMDQAFARIDELEKENGTLKTTLTDVTGQLDESNKILEGQEKAKLIGEIMPRSSFKMDELVAKNMDELKSIRATLDQAKLPRVNSVRVGVMGVDLSDREKGLTVGDLSVVTAAKRKAQEAA